jgi:choline dehydrogenase-like flavoprotein
MANFNIDATKERTFQAIVIGSGMSGSWAAKELCEHGVKTLVIERGRDVKHIKDYPTTNMLPYEFEHRGQIPRKFRKKILWSVDVMHLRKMPSTFL